MCVVVCFRCGYHTKMKASAATRMSLLLLLLAVFSGLASAEEDGGDVPLLYVQTAAAAKFEGGLVSRTPTGAPKLVGGELILSEVDEAHTIFADRPIREAGTMSKTEFLSLFSAGNTFSEVYSPLVHAKPLAFLIENETLMLRIS